MITGNVNPDHEPIIEVILHDIHGREHKRPGVVDTGFTGWLTLPPDLIVALGLPWKELGTAILADGSQIYFDVYEVTVIWDGQPITFFVDESDSEPLVGMALMYGYNIFIQNVDGGIVTLRRSTTP